MKHSKHIHQVYWCLPVKSCYINGISCRSIEWKCLKQRKEFDGNYVVPSEDHNLKISMENLRLRDDCQGRNISEEVIKFLWEGRAVSWSMDNWIKKKMLWKDWKYVQLILMKLAVWINIRGRRLTREGNIVRKFLTRREQTWCKESSENIVGKIFCYTYTRMMSLWKRN